MPKNMKRTSHPKIGRGFTLVEVMVATTLGSFMALAAAGSFQWVSRAGLHGREQMQGTKLAQLLHSRLDKMDYHQVLTPLRIGWNNISAAVLPLDSSKPNFGFEAGYTPPSKVVLGEVQREVEKAGFTHFTIDLEFLRRDSADNNRNRGVMDLVPFDDGNYDGVDDRDVNVRFFDADGDGRFYGTYMNAAGKTLSEVPDTHVRGLTLKVWKKDKLVAKHGFFLTKEKLTGVENPSTQSSLKFTQDAPRNYAPLYQMASPALAAAMALPIRKPPLTDWRYQADTLVPLRPVGFTEPGALVEVYVGGNGIWSPGAVVTPNDVGHADAYGNFTVDAINSTAALREGLNIVTTRCVKGALVSPYHPQEQILDINPPEILDAMPEDAQVPTLSPVIACLLIDRPTEATRSVNPNAVVSGLTGYSTAFLVRRRGEVDYVDYHVDRYNTAVPDSAPGVLRQRDTSENESSFLLLDKVTRLPQVLEAGAVYEVRVEGADGVRYRTAREWSFAVAPDMADATPPRVQNEGPHGNAGSGRPTISCVVDDPESGLDASSLSLTVFGNGVSLGGVDGAAVADVYDPVTGRISYTPSAAFPSGISCTVSVRARNWAMAPGSPAPEVESWTFNVP